MGKFKIITEEVSRYTYIVTGVDNSDEAQHVITQLLTGCVANDELPIQIDKGDFELESEETLSWEIKKVEEV